jgi:molybdopterin molybdotransferase
LNEALRLVLDDCELLADSESCPLSEALGRVLCEDVESPVAVPSADNAAMDGYALRAADADGPLRVAQRIAAGATGTTLQPGTAARIFTGAPIPPGADAVAMQEDCQLSDDQVVVSEPVKLGQHIRPRGQDIQQGQLVFSAGRLLRSQDLGVLASVGLARVPTFRPLTVGILSTGDELVEPGAAEQLAPGQVFNSNRYTLRGLLTGLGMRVSDFGMVADTAEATARALSEAAAACDCVISSGGVSVGEEDHVRDQVEKLGHLNLWKLAIKPGKPLAYGRIGQTPFFGLPGNPASVFVTFALVVRPALWRLQGAEPQDPLELTACADFEFKRPGRRAEYLRVRALVEDGVLMARPHDNQSSGVLSAVSWANALAVIPPGQTIAPGDPVTLMLLDQLGR